MCNIVCACLLVCSLMLFATCVELQKPKHPASSNRHALVRPVVHLARTKRQLPTTRQESGLHHHELSVTVNVEGKPYTLDLKLNHDLMPEGHILSYQDGGKTVLHKPKKEEIDLCQYTGHIRGKPTSWVALSTCHGLRGAINDGSKIRYIEPSEGSDLQSLHYVYEQDKVKTEQRCGNDDLYPHSINKLIRLTKEPNQRNNTLRTRHKRETSFPIRGGPFKATERSRYVELVLVTDYALYRGVNGDLKMLYHQLQESTNILHAIYAPLNIFIALTGVEVWTGGDRITLGSNGSKTLKNFMQYRREELLKRMPNHDHAQLITAKKFDDGVIGEAYVSKMGTYELSGAIVHRPAYGVSAATIASTAGIMAHEMGHNFGMSHDTEDSGCQDKFCIMHSSAVNPIPTHFSETSLKELMMELNKGIDYTLRNKPERLFGAPSCGNGFVDPGEECDCGVRVKGIKPSGCHRCCNPNTCRLRANATCAMGACCNLETCQIKPVATLCRAAGRECDLPEYCTGDSEYCPEDVFKMDTTPCADKAYCVQGKCRSHGTQCRLLWGSTAQNGKPDCYGRNTNGDTISNCGYDVLTKSSRRCKEEDASCGRLYCHHYSPRLKFANFHYHLRNSYSSYYANGFSKCDAVRIDSVNSVDPGLVPEGAECGAGQMCLQQKCRAVDDVRAEILQHHSEGCRANCSGHGTCNSKGHCHCDDGFAPPLCEVPGVGGSGDSGPAGNPNVQKTFKLVMYIVFLGLVPLIALILLLMFFMKRKSLLCFDQNTSSHRSISSTSAVKKAILSLFNTKGKNTKSSNTSTDLNRNVRPESLKNVAKHDIQIIRNFQADAALQSDFDINSYVNYRNGTQDTTMTITKEDIKIIPNTVEDVPKPSVIEDINVNKYNLSVRKEVKHASQIKPVNNINPTHPNLAIPIKHKAENAYNPVSTTVEKQNAIIIAKRPIENTAFVLQTVKHKGDANVNNTKFEAKQKVPLFDKPIPPQKPTKLYQPLSKDTKPTPEANNLASKNTSEPWPKLKPVKNSPLIRKNVESSSEIITKEITNELPRGGLSVKNMKNFYEDL